MLKPRPRTGGALILLDFDGTLIDSEPGILVSLRHAFDAAGLPAPTEAQLRTFLGPPLHVSLAGIGITGPPADEVVVHYRQHYNDHGMFDAEPFPGIEAALTDLRGLLDGALDAPSRLVVATSKPESVASVISERVGLDEYLDAIYGASLDGTRTSKADVITRALAHESTFAFDRSLMIGDRIYDVVGAAAHGIATLGALWGYGSAEELTDAGAIGNIAAVDRLPEAVLAAVAAGDR